MGHGSIPWAHSSEAPNNLWNSKNIIRVVLKLMITVERQHKRKNTHSIQLETPLSPFYYIYEIQLSFKILSYISIQKDPQQIRIYSLTFVVKGKQLS